MSGIDTRAYWLAQRAEAQRILAAIVALDSDDVLGQLSFQARIDECNARLGEPLREGTERT